MNNQKFYEFNKHEYYGLVVAESEEKAYEVYFNTVGGDSVNGVKSEGKPKQITFYEALGRMLDADIRQGEIDINKTTLNQYYNEFNLYENTALLIDGSLL